MIGGQRATAFDSCTMKRTMGFAVVTLLLTGCVLPIPDHCFDEAPTLLGAWCYEDSSDSYSGYSASEMLLPGRIDLHSDHTWSAEYLDSVDYPEPVRKRLSNGTLSGTWDGGQSCVRGFYMGVHIDLFPQVPYTHSERLYDERLVLIGARSEGTHSYYAKCAAEADPARRSNKAAAGDGHHGAVR
jgi:hypothetical protein